MMTLNFQRRRAAAFWGETRGRARSFVNGMYIVLVHAPVVFENEGRTRLGIVIPTLKGEPIFIHSPIVYQMGEEMLAYTAKLFGTANKINSWEPTIQKLKETFQSIKSNPDVVKNIPIYDPTAWRGFRYVKEKTPALRQP